MKRHLEKGIKRCSYIKYDCIPINNTIQFLRCFGGITLNK